MYNLSNFTMFIRNWAKSSPVKGILSHTSSCWNSWKSDLTMSGYLLTHPQCPGFRSKHQMKDTGMQIYVQDESCIWGAGGAALSLPHHVYRCQRFSLSFNDDLALRTIFSLLLGSNEDRLKTPEGLHHWRFRPSYSHQRLELQVLENIPWWYS